MVHHLCDGLWPFHFHRPHVVTANKANTDSQQCQQMTSPHVIQSQSFSVSSPIMNLPRPFISHLRAYCGTNTPYFSLPNKSTLTQRRISTNRAILCLSPRSCVRILVFRDLRVCHHASAFHWPWPRVVRRLSPVYVLDDSPSLTIDNPPSNNPMVNLSPLPS